MLKALYDYALRNHLSPPSGYAPKRIKAWISVSTLSDFINVVQGDELDILCPDIGSLANGTKKSNVLAEKRSVIFPDENSDKTAFFLKTMRDAAACDPAWIPCLGAIENTDKRRTVLAELDRMKVKPGDRISFLIDGKPGVSSEKTVSWWRNYREQITEGNSRSDSLCMITGAPAVPMTTTPPIQGLHAVGGHARGDALISFDKSSFTSYGLKQAENAPVSEEAYTAVKAALDSLLMDASILAGMKFVHWYDREIPIEADPLKNVVAPLDDDEDEDLPETEIPVNEAAERRRADTVPVSVKSGVVPEELDSAQYYILMLTGVGGRVMVRRYERGNYAELRENIRRWYEDLSLTNPAGTADIKDRKLTARLMRLMKYQKNDREPFKRMEKELAGVTPAVVEAIMYGTPLPDSVAARALAYIRSKMFESETVSDAPRRSPEIPDGTACQWLRIWLLRRAENEKKERKLMSEYNADHPNAAYHCGAVMAICAAIQNIAMPDVGAGVIQRYFASAMQTPSLVLGQLSKLSNYHLDKIESRALSKLFREKLAEAWSRVGDTVPTALNLEQQSYFTLGYYQMSALLNREKAQFFANRKQKDENKALNTEEDE